MCSNKVHYLFNGVVSSILLANYAWSIMDYFDDHEKLAKYYWVWIPFFFLLFDAFVLLVAVVRVYRVLRQENVISVHEKYMAMQVILLLLLALGNGFVSLAYLQSSENTFWSWTVNAVIEFIVTLVMLFIMWRVSGKEKVNYKEV